MILAARTIWLALNALSSDSLMPRASGRAIAIPKGNVVEFACAAFNGDPANSANLVTNLTGVISASFIMRAEKPTGAVMLSKTVALGSFDNPALAFADWLALSDRQFTFRLTSAETNFAIDAGKTERDVYIAIQFDTAGGPILLGKAMGKLFDDGIVDAGEPTVPSDPPYLNQDQSDARYGRPGINVAHYLSAVTGYTGGGAAALDGVATTTKAAGYLVQFDIPGAEGGLKSFILRAGTAAEAAPGIVRPDDYDGDDNAKYWEQRA